uniref:Uncharacterized protein n=1 Tax=Strigamia maritima TaxID=126957 RepID=T1J0I8_STRMM
MKKQSNEFSAIDKLRGKSQGRQNYSQNNRFPNSANYNSRPNQDPRNGNNRAYDQNKQTFTKPHRGRGRSRGNGGNKPVKTLVFLGFELNSKLMTVSLPPERIKSIQESIRKILH